MRGDITSMHRSLLNSACTSALLETSGLQYKWENFLCPTPTLPVNSVLLLDEPQLLISRVLNEPRFSWSCFIKLHRNSQLLEYQGSCMHYTSLLLALLSACQQWLNAWYVFALSPSLLHDWPCALAYSSRQVNCDSSAVPVSAAFLSSPCRLRWFWGPISLLANKNGGSFSKSKRAGIWSWTLTSEVIKTWIYTTIAPIRLNGVALN